MAEVFRDYKKNVLLGWGARWIDGVVFNVYAVFTIAYLVGIAEVRQDRRADLDFGCGIRPDLHDTGRRRTGPTASAGARSTAGER